MDDDENMTLDDVLPSSSRQKQSTSLPLPTTAPSSTNASHAKHSESQHNGNSQPPTTNSDNAADAEPSQRARATTTTASSFAAASDFNQGGSLNAKQLKQLFEQGRVGEPARVRTPAKDDAQERFARRKTVSSIKQMFEAGPSSEPAPKTQDPTFASITPLQTRISTLTDHSSTQAVTSASKGPVGRVSTSAFDAPEPASVGRPTTTTTTRASAATTSTATADTEGTSAASDATTSALAATTAATTSATSTSTTTSTTTTTTPTASPEKRHVSASAPSPAKSSGGDVQSAQEPKVSTRDYKIHSPPPATTNSRPKVQQAGVGILLELHQSVVTVKAVADGGPAAQCDKMRVGAQIFAINDKSLDGVDFSAVVGLIMGPVGTEVRFKVHQPDDPPSMVDEVVLKRELLKLPSKKPTDSRPAEFTGVGILLEQSGEDFVVRKIAAHGPAGLSPFLKVGHILLGVDDVDVRGKPFIEVLDLVRGPVGSQVLLNVKDVDTSEVQVVPLIRNYVLQS